MNQEETIRALSEVISAQSGELHALRSAVLGLLKAAPSPEAGRRVRQELERAYADELAVSTNPAAIASFELSMALLLEGASIPTGG